MGQLRADMEHGRVELLGEIGRLNARLEEVKRESQAAMSLPARSRAMRMLRTGMSPDTAALESGMPRSEIRLLQKIAFALGRK